MVRVLAAVIGAGRHTRFLISSAGMIHIAKVSFAETMHRHRLRPPKVRMALNPHLPLSLPLQPHFFHNAFPLLNVEDGIDLVSVRPAPPRNSPQTEP